MTSQEGAKVTESQEEAEATEREALEKLLLEKMRQYIARVEETEESIEVLERNTESLNQELGKLQAGNRTLSKRISLMTGLYLRERLAVVAQALVVLRRGARRQGGSLAEARSVSDSSWATVAPDLPTMSDQLQASYNAYMAQADFRGSACGSYAPDPNILKDVIEMGVRDAFITREVLDFLRAHFFQICGIEFSVA